MYIGLCYFCKVVNLFNNLKIYTSMKKLMALLVVAGMTFVACGNKTVEEPEVVEEETVEAEAPVQEEEAAEAETPAEEVAETPAE